MNYLNLGLFLVALVITLVFYHKKIVILLTNKIADLESHITDLENRNQHLEQKYSDREKEIQNLYSLLLEKKLNKAIGIDDISSQNYSLPSGYYIVLSIINAIKGYYQYKYNENSK